MPASSFAPLHDEMIVCKSVDEVFPSLKELLVVILIHVQATFSLTGLLTLKFIVYW